MAADRVFWLVVASKKYEVLSDDDLGRLTLTQLTTAVDHLRRRSEFDTRLFRRVSNLFLRQAPPISSSAATFCLEWCSDESAAEGFLIRSCKSSLSIRTWLQCVRIGLQKNFRMPSVGLTLLEVVSKTGSMGVMSADDRRTLLESYLALETWLSRNPALSSFEAMTRFLVRTDEKFTDLINSGNLGNSSLKILLASTFLRSHDDLYYLENQEAIDEFLEKVVAEFPDVYAATIAGIFAAEVLAKCPDKLSIGESKIGGLISNDLSVVPSPLLKLAASQQPSIKFTKMILSKVELSPLNAECIKEILEIRKQIPTQFIEPIRKLFRKSEAMGLMRQSLVAQSDPKLEPNPDKATAGAEWILQGKGSPEYIAKWSQKLDLRGKVSEVARQALALAAVEVEEEVKLRLRPVCLRWLTADVDPELYDELCELEFLF